MLIKTKSLREVKAFASKKISDIIDFCWKENNLSLVFTVSDFKRLSLSDVQNQDFEYATITCTVDIGWDTLVRFIFGPNEVQQDYVFLEALCSRISTDKKELIMFQQSIIFEHSKEHHIIEPRCFEYSECWFYFSFFDPKLRPILHDSNCDPSSVEKLKRGLNEKGFDFVYNSTNREDIIIDFVKRDIVVRWKSIENFDSRVRQTIVSALEVSKVCAYNRIAHHK